MGWPRGSSSRRAISKNSAQAAAAASRRPAAVRTATCATTCIKGMALEGGKQSVRHPESTSQHKTVIPTRTSQQKQSSPQLNKSTQNSQSGIPTRTSQHKTVAQAFATRQQVNTSYVVAL